MLAGVLLVSVVVFVYWFARRPRRFSPRGGVVYQDETVAGRSAPVMEDAALHLRGRPDQVVRGMNGQLVINEFKSGICFKDRPYLNHAAQVAATFPLVEAFFGEPVAYGLVQYQNQQYRVDNTEEAREGVVRLANMVRMAIENPEPAPANCAPNKCESCPFRLMCPEGQATVVR